MRAAARPGIRRGRSLIPTPSTYTNIAGAHDLASYVSGQNTFRRVTPSINLRVRRIEQEFYSVTTAMTVRAGFMLGSPAPATPATVPWLASDNAALDSYADLTVPAGNSTVHADFPDDITLTGGTLYTYVAFILSGGGVDINLADGPSTTATPNLAWATNVSFGSGTSFTSGGNNASDSTRPSLVLFRGDP